MSTATIELSSTRRRLFEALGENQHQYLDHIKTWFRKRCTKEEFDTAARKLLTTESVHLHNQFLLALLNKCQTLVNMSPCPTLTKVETQTASSNPELLSPSKFDVPDRLKKGKIKRKSKPNRASLEHRFQPVSVSNCAPEVSLPASITPEEKGLQYCVRESLLPDISLIHGRLLVSAWEEGLEGVEEAAVKLTLSAVEQQLRKIIFSLVKTRNSWQQTQGLIHSLGSAAPNPWLLNTQSKRKVVTGDRDTAVAANLLNEQCLAPAQRTEADRAEAEAMYSLSLSRPPRCTQPLGLFDLVTALHMDRDVIPNHSVYSINMERCILRLHPTT